jgi:hypothetical protein
MRWLTAEQGCNKAVKAHGLEKRKAMQYVSSLAIAAAAFCLAGCASAPKIALEQPLGPAPAQRPAPSGNGSLVVYSARVPAPLDLNSDEWISQMHPEWNAFHYEPAHTAYTIYAKDGQPVQTVANANDQHDPLPTVVSLAPGAYRVQAQAVDCHQNRITVILPVVIKPGETTVAHLDSPWRPPVYADNDVARLPCGRIIGWSAPAQEFNNMVSQK